jgi:hypothetical protein
LLKTKIILLFGVLWTSLNSTPLYANNDMIINDPHPQSYFCKSLPVDQNTKFDQYERQMREANRDSDACRKRNKKRWRQFRDAKLRELEEQGKYRRNHWHDNDNWRQPRLSDKEIRHPKKYAEFLADQQYCPHFMRAVKDPIADTIDSVTSLNDFFKSDRASLKFADNLGNEIYNWVVLRASGKLGELKLDSKGRLMGDEFKGDIGFFGKMGLFFSDGDSEPKRVLHFLADYVEEGSIEDRKFKLQKIQILLDVFQEILSKDAVGIAEFSSLQPTNFEQVEKYRALAKEIFRGFLGQTDENRAIKQLTTATHSAASNVMKDFLEMKLESFEIKRKEDRESILGAVSYVLGETDQNTNPPIETREFEFFPGASMFGKHLKGDVKTCLECALNMSAMVMCYQRAYQTLQDPLVKWTLRKFEINTPNPSGDPDAAGGIAIEGTGAGTTRVNASLGKVGNRFEDYLQTGDFFESFLKPSNYDEVEGPQPDQSLSINFLNTTKNVFENSYSNPPEKNLRPSDLTDDPEKAQSMQMDPEAMNWIAFQNGWNTKREKRVREITEEVRREYNAFAAQKTPAITFEEAVANRVETNPMLDKLKLHYAMESTLRFMTEQSINTLLMQLNLTPEKIAEMEEPLKSKAQKTRDLIQDKKLDIFSRTIPEIVGKRLDAVLNDPDMKDLPLFEYAIENLRQKSVEDGFEIINKFMNAPSIQEVVQGVSEYKYTEISQLLDIDENDEIGKGLHAIIIGTQARPSLSNQIFGEVQGFFKDIHRIKEERGIKLTDDEFEGLFDTQLLKLNDNLLNYTFTGENKKLFKDLVYNLYEKYMNKIISIDPDHASNEDLMAIKAKIDAFVKDKADDIINTLKLRSHGMSPLKVIESIEENLVDVLNQDVFGNGEAKDLLKALTHELMAVNIEKYAGIILPSEEAEKIRSEIENRPEGTSKMDAAFGGLVSLFYNKYGSNTANIAEVVLSLKSHVDGTFDSFFEQGNQKSIDELVTDLNDKITRDFGKFVLKNEFLLKETIQNQKDIIEDRIARYTTDSDEELRTAITNFQNYVDNRLTGDASLKLITTRIEDLLEQDNLKVNDLLEVGQNFANERFWQDPDSRKHVDTLVDEIINAEKRRIKALLGKTYDSFDPIKKKRMMRKFEKLFAEQKAFLNKHLDNVFDKAQKGEYIELYQETLADSIKMMNQNILKESNCRHLLEEVLKDSVTNGIKEVNTATILPDSTKQELTRIRDKVVADLDTIFDREVEKEFESFAGVITFVDDIAHYSINEVIVTESKNEDVGYLFASTIYDTKGLAEFKAMNADPNQQHHFVFTHEGRKFQSPHPRQFENAAGTMIQSLRLQQMPVSEEQMLTMSQDDLEGETLGKYITRLQDSNYSLIGPMLGEISEVIRFQSFCPQFSPKPDVCIDDPDAEQGKGKYNKMFLQGIKFIRMAAASEQEGCKENVSNLLTRENLMKLAESSSQTNRGNGDYWNINLWLSEIIKSNRDVTPSIVECALTNTMADIQDVMEKNKKAIEGNAGEQVHQIIDEVLTPEMLIKLREENPDLYKGVYDRLSEFLLNPNGPDGETSNITDVITDHVNNEILPKVVDTPLFQQKALLLYANANINKPADEQVGNITLWFGKYFTSVDSEMVNALQADFSANITQPEMEEIYKHMPDCADDIAKDILGPLTLNTQALIKQTISPDATATGYTDDGKSFCFKNTDGQLYCIPVTPDNQDAIEEAKTLDALIKETIEALETVEGKYTTYNEEVEYDRATRRYKKVCKPERNLYDFRILGLQVSSDSFFSQEKALVDRYKKTIKKYMQDMLRSKFLLRSVKEVLPELRSGNKRLAAVKLREIYQKKSAKSKWVSGGYAVAYYSGGYQQPAGEFRQKLDEENLKKLEEEFEKVAKCLEEQ